jgi:site-specific DNA-adenine methylase
MLKSFFPIVGGKSLIKKIIVEESPSTFNRYFEPFLGAGTLLYGLEPKEAVVNDINIWNIALHICVRDHLDDFCDQVDLLSNKVDVRDTFLKCIHDFNQRLRKYTFSTNSINKEFVKQTSIYYFVVKKCYGSKVWFQDLVLHWKI